MGFTQCRSDACLFVRISQQGPILVILYVDDMLIGCVDKQDTEAIKPGLSERFKMKVLGDARFVLGMEATYARGEGKLRLCQSQFIDRMVTASIFKSKRQ
jgi:hypothetical protein